MNPGPPPLTPGLALMLAALTGLFQSTTILLLQGLGFPFGLGLFGMSALLAYGLAFALCSPRIPKPPSLGLALVRPPRAAWLAALLLISALLLSSEVDNLVKRVLPLPEDLRRAEGAPPPPLVQLFLVSVVVYPLVQELLFRGVLQPLVVQSLGVRRGIALTAILNALSVSLATFHPWFLAPTAINAAVLGLLRETSGSLLPSCLLHMLWGIVGVGAAYGSFGIPGFDSTPPGHTPLHWLVPAAVFTGVGLRLCRSAAASPPLR